MHNSSSRVSPFVKWLYLCLSRRERRIYYFECEGETMQIRFTPALRKNWRMFTCFLECRLDIQSTIDVYESTRHLMIPKCQANTIRAENWFRRKCISARRVPTILNLMNEKTTLNNTKACKVHEIFTFNDDQESHGISQRHKRQQRKTIRDN